MPPSWVTPIVIDRDTHRARFPAQKRIMAFRDCVVEKYAEYYEGMQGLVLQVSTYETEPDDSSSGSHVVSEFATEVRSEFKHRADRLVRRVTYPMDERVHEFYARGRDGGLMEFIQVLKETQPDC